MKPAAYLLLLLLLSVAVAAQDAAKQPFSENQSPAQAPGVRVPLSDELISIGAREKTCYTIRAYFFKPSEAGGVEPAGMTTCVRSNQRALKRIQQGPRKATGTVLLTY